MHAVVSSRLDALAELCRRFHVRRLEVFGSAARGDDFDPARSDADFLVEFESDVKLDITTLLDVQEALEQVIGRPVDLVERQAVEESGNYLDVAKSCAKQNRFMSLDEPLLLDMLLAAREAFAFVSPLDPAQFAASKLHVSRNKLPELIATLLLLVPPDPGDA